MINHKLKIIISVLVLYFVSVNAYTCGPYAGYSDPDDNRAWYKRTVLRPVKDNNNLKLYLDKTYGENGWASDMRNNIFISQPIEGTTSDNIRLHISAKKNEMEDCKNNYPAN